MGRKKPEKYQGFNRIQTCELCDTGAMLNQLSCEATHWERGQFVEFIGSEVNLLGSHLPAQNILYLQPQYKYGFHIYFTSFHCTGRYNLNKLTSLPHSSVGQALHRYRGGHHGSNPVVALTFFRLLPSNFLNWKIYCNDHSSLSFTTTVQIWISYIFI